MGDYAVVGERDDIDVDALVDLGMDAVDADADDIYDGLTDYDGVLVLDDGVDAGAVADGTPTFSLTQDGDAAYLDVDADPDAVYDAVRDRAYGMNLARDVVDGDDRALARAISTIEDRAHGYRDLVSDLYEAAGDAHVIGVTGSPGAGKSTLVDQLVDAYTDDDEQLGIVAVDPSSPFTDGAILGDRIRMSHADDVFFRSMSSRGSMGGLSTATTGAITAMDAYGMDRIIVETVGAGQDEVDIVRTADTVSVVVQPQSGDAVQYLKAGILETGDVFVMNKADLDGADRTVKDLRDMLHERESMAVGVGRYGMDWTPPVVETIAIEGDGVDELVDVLDDHQQALYDADAKQERERMRHAETIRTLLQDDLSRFLDEELDQHGGIEALAGNVVDGAADPYEIVDNVLQPLKERFDG